MQTVLEMKLCLLALTEYHRFIPYYLNNYTLPLQKLIT